MDHTTLFWRLKSLESRGGQPGSNMKSRRLRGMLQGFALAVLFTIAGVVPALTLNLGNADEPSVIQIDPTEDSVAGNEALSHYKRGLDFERSGSLNQAVSEYKAAIGFDGTMVQAYCNLGELYCRLKQFGPAAGTLTKALSLDPSRAETLNALGELNYARGLDKLAIERWRQTIQRDPRFASAYFNLGLALERQGELEEARESYSKALALDPTMARVIERLSNLSQHGANPLNMSSTVPAAADTSVGAFIARSIEEPAALTRSGELHKSLHEEPVENVVPAARAFEAAAAACSSAALRAPEANDDLPVLRKSEDAARGGSDIMFEPAGVSISE